MKNRWIGMDIGAEMCTVTLAEIDQGIHIMDEVRFDTEISQGFDNIFQHLCRTVRDLFANNRITREELAAIGVNCGGPFNARKGMILCSPDLSGWGSVPITGMLTEHFGVPVFLQNDADAYALVEWKMGAGRGTENMIFLDLGTSVSAGIIAGGQLLNSLTGIGGEAGYVSLKGEGSTGFSKTGCFGRITGENGMKSRAMDLSERMLADGRVPAWIRDGIRLEDTDEKVLAAYARKGDEDAKSFFGSLGETLGRRLALLADAFNPEVIVIGSIYGRCRDLLEERMILAMHREAASFLREGLRVLPMETGERISGLAGVMTAAIGMGIDPADFRKNAEEEAEALFEDLFERYPALEVCRQAIRQAADEMAECFRSGHKLLLIGNGGSCADCGHIAGELMKGFLLKRPLELKVKNAVEQHTADIMPEAAELLQQGLPVIDLTQHSALNTAVQNDQSPLLAAAQQLMAYGRRGDLLISISTSGNSQNVLIAAAVARALGMKTIGLTGDAGGRLKTLCDIAITVPAEQTAQVQEMHLPVYHTLCAMTEASLFGGCTAYAGKET